MEQQIGVLQLLQGRFEGLHQVVGQLADKAHRIGEENGAGVGDLQGAGRGVQGIKQAVVGGDIRPGVDNPLSPSQQRNLAEELKVGVLDRSALILDIFAQRARTREGRLQVELAQYQYLLPSRVALKASTRWWGSLRMKPTVSDSRTVQVSEGAGVHLRQNRRGGARPAGRHREGAGQRGQAGAYPPGAACG